MCVSGVVPCLLVCDAKLKPGTVILYGIGGRTGAEIKELTERFDGRKILDQCGTELSTQTVGPKMLWFRRHGRRH